jgi:hypothetical protein
MTCERFTKVLTNLGVAGQHPSQGPSAALRLAIAGDSSSKGHHPMDPHPTRPTTDRRGAGPEGCLHGGKG